MSISEENVDALAKKIWEYMLMHHTLKRTDCILVFGCKDTRPAEYAAELFLRGYAPWMLFSGGLGRITKDFFSKTEAETFAEIAQSKGVPADRMILEKRASGTFENVEFSKKILEERGIAIHTAIFVHKPYMERRLHATLKKQWPEIEHIITSPQISYEDNPIPRDNYINGMVGDLQRIKVYAERGLQIPQEIPKDVWSAYEELVRLGFNKQLVKE